MFDRISLINDFLSPFCSKSTRKFKDNKTRKTVIGYILASTEKNANNGQTPTIAVEINAKVLRR